MVDNTDLIPTMKAVISDVSELLAVQPVVACQLLMYFKWQKENIFNSYMSDGEKAVKDAGVYERSKCIIQNSNGAEQECQICMDDCSNENMMSMPCGHSFCLDCWEDFLKNMLSSGPSCIFTKCPQFGCNEVVTENEVGKVIPDSVSTYSSYILQDFVNRSGYSRCCPGPDCHRIATYQNGLSLFGNERKARVTCDTCHTSFCVKCGEEPHAPLTCSLSTQFKAKYEEASSTAGWLLSNTRACPKCKARIEKKGGCSRMRCQQCNYEFCWLCMGKWHGYSETRSGTYCKIAEERGDTLPDEDNDLRLLCMGRYKTHGDSQKLVLDMIPKLETAINKDPSDLNLDFLLDANLQLINSRRVLKNSFAFRLLMQVDDRQQERYEHDLHILEMLTEQFQEVTELISNELINLEEMTEHNMMIWGKMHPKLMKKIGERKDDIITKVRCM